MNAIKKNESLEDYFTTLRVEIDLQKTKNLTEIRKVLEQEIKARWLIKDILAKCATPEEAFERIAEKYGFCVWIPGWGAVHSFQVFQGICAYPDLPPSMAQTPNIQAGPVFGGKVIGEGVCCGGPCLEYPFL